jgi:O-antigen ligase
VLAFFEFTRRWLLYDGLRAALGVPLDLLEPTYLFRGGGLLRATASLGNSIALGYVMMLALCLWMYLQPLLVPRWKARSAAGLLIAGLISGMSRGPWVGATSAIATFTVFGRGAGKRIGIALVVLSVILALLLITPLGDIVIPYLPFVGTVETGNIDYRATLVDVSMLVFKEHPIAGDLFYMRNPILEQMRQGQGIIDIVNTYLQVALPFGAIGLALFAGVFVCALKGVARVRKQSTLDPEAERLARALFAGQVGILVTIGTVSGISVIPTVYWLWAGLCASFVRVFAIESVVHERRSSNIRAKTHSPRTTNSAGAQSRPKAAMKLTASRSKSGRT